MTVYPLRVANGHEAPYRTLDQALKGKKFTVTEVSEGGSVGELRVKNGDQKPVLLILGEELVGAKQNRTLNTSILVPADSKLNIPVNCVEQGRWSYRGREFISGGSSHAFLRHTQMHSTTLGLARSGSHTADQGEVWGEVARSMSVHGASSGTGAMDDTYAHKSDELKAYTDAFADLGEAQGALVVIDGRVVGLDLFDTADTLSELWPKLARSYALDALEPARKPAEDSGEDYIEDIVGLVRTPPEANQETLAEDDEGQAGVPEPEPDDEAQAAAPEPELDVEGFLKAAAEAKQESFDGVGLGTDVRLTSEKVSGSGLLWEDRVVHLSVFQAVK
jgi:hypothetical protein